MATKKITELAELVTATNDDVFPIVDVGNDITKKIKTVNLPISSATQTALNLKEDVANKSTSVTTDQSSNTKYPSVKAVYDWAVGLFATIAQLATKQDTLVSGTNIKTINSTSLLGTGDISIQANPSGGAGAIQFSDGSAFASDSNLFWDNTNKRLGVGTNAPTSALHNTGVSRFSSVIIGQASATAISSTSQDVAINLASASVGIGGFTTFTPSARLHVRGSGSTSATTALLVQNSAGSNILQIKDSREIDVYSLFRVLDSNGNNSMIMYGDGYSGIKTLWVNGVLGVGVLGNNASAILQADSTNRGFLPPRMTTTQKNAISSPAAGLVVYDTTTNKLCCYNGTSWNDLF